MRFFHRSFHSIHTIYPLTATMYEQPCCMRGLFAEGMRATHKVLYVADKLIRQFLPRIAKHLDHETIHVTMYATQWLLTVYTSSFPFELVTRVWDCFLFEGWKIVYRVMLALLQRGDLLKLRFEEILGRFREMSKSDLTGIIEAACKIPLKTRHIQKYEKEWTTLSSEQQVQQGSS
jgi:Rab-GTPase-TBC domain